MPKRQRAGCSQLLRWDILFEKEKKYVGGRKGRRVSEIENSLRDLKSSVPSGCLSCSNEASNEACAVRGAPLSC